MDKCKEIEQKLSPCKHCGNEHPKVFHQDYNGDNYVGDEYSINCKCGICTGWFDENEIVRIWNASNGA